ncbi:MAG: hypothetical protein WAM91_17215, partial [Candidatus Acidiferrales bacterium]
NVTVIDGATNNTTTVAAGTEPYAVAVNPVTNKIYVSKENSDNVTVIEGATNNTTTVAAGTAPQGVSVNPVTNKIYVVNANGSNVTVIDGATNTTTTVAAGTEPFAVAVNPVTNQIYVTNFTSENVTVLTEQQVQPIPLTNTITPLAGNTTSNTTPTFTFSASSSFAPSAPPVDALYFQFDTWQGPWMAATSTGVGAFRGTAPTLAVGVHIVYAYATDGQDATSTNTGFEDGPVTGAISAYLFLVTPAPSNPVPTITTLSPTIVDAGSGTFIVTINGTNFISTSVVNFGGAARATTFVSATQVTAAILAGDVASPGSPSVTVTNPAPGGGTSNSVAFTVGNPVPAITSLVPNTVSAGSGAFTLTVNGSSFINGSVVQWNGSNRTTAFVNAGQLTAMITAADVQTANIISVTVFNPAPGGGTSNIVDFTVTTPIPALVSLVPNSATAGGPAFMMTLNGGNFISTSVAQWNGGNRATTFVNSMQLTAMITAADILTVGTASVQVFTPTVVFGGVNRAQPLGAPTGTTSNALTFTTNAANPVPTLTTLQPSSTGAGGAAFTLTLNGTNFISSSVAQWKGAALTTTFVNTGQLTAAIPASDIAASGTAAVTVMNPTPGGGTSNALTFTITDFSVTPTTTSQTVTAGQSANFTIATAAVGGAFPGTVTFTASGLPSGAAATFNPSSVSAGTSTTMTVTTTSRTAAQTVPTQFNPRGPMRPLWLVAFMLMLAIATASLVKVGRRPVQHQVQRSIRRLIPIGALVLLLGVVGYLSGCNGGFPGVAANVGTPAGTYTITVTGASGSVQHSTNVILKVQ